VRIGIGVSLLAALLGGCGGDDADSVFVNATWSFRSVASNTALPCPDTFTKVELHVGDHVTTFDCADGMGRSDAIPKGTYDAFLTVTNDDASQLYATSTPGELDLTLSDRTFSRQFLTDGGVFHAGWTLVDKQGSPVDCVTANATTIVIEAVDESDPTIDNIDELDCEDGEGYSFGYPAGSYRVTLEAFDADDLSLGITDPADGQVITPPNGITEVGTLALTISGL
jgi:hypothetical protein